MRNALIISASLGSLVAILYLSASTRDCETELSACLSEPPLFVKIKGAEGKPYCLDHFKTCLTHGARTAAEKAAALAVARQKAADVLLVTQTVGVASDSAQFAERDFDGSTIYTSGD